MDATTTDDSHLPAVKRPKRPEPTSATVEELLAHHNVQAEALAMGAGYKALTPGDNVPKDRLIELIRKQNRLLGRTVKRRALELLEARIKGPDGRPLTDQDGRSVGLKYLEVLDILRGEFPEASTSVACLRWYIVHLKIDANDQGLPWPDLPQVRPRAKTKAEAA